ncbi:MAG TPA: hypothetical protein VM010_04610, partial [Chitinophagaceae bacterium]|nr:hypothetical protein [Chitinophagaceae bacterium]
MWWLAWPTSPLTFLAFLAFVPLLFIEQSTTSNRQFLRLAYVHMLVWNAGTTWWIYNASFAGAALAIVLNSLLMCVPWLLMRRIKKSFGRVAGYAALISFWISFEAIHQSWELSWPWLTLGNVFAVHPKWIQWYEFTGTSGGSVWILTCNVILFLAITGYRQYVVLKKLRPLVIALLLLVSIPLFVSYAIYKKQETALVTNSS